MKVESPLGGFKGKSWERTHVRPGSQVFCAFQVRNPSTKLPLLAILGGGPIPNPKKYEPPVAGFLRNPGGFKRKLQRDIYQVVIHPKFWYHQPKDEPPIQGIRFFLRNPVLNWENLKGRSRCSPFFRGSNFLNRRASHGLLRKVAWT